MAAFIQDGRWCKPTRWPPKFDNVWEEISQLDVGGSGPDILVWTGSKTGRLVTKQSISAFSVELQSIVVHSSFLTKSLLLIPAIVKGRTVVLDGVHYKARR
ncbi:hypothetical protein QJS10_CPA09g01008 [Acorus calamus]|uniref:Uncharacterized protein n=1 Tax=Acorus calamus TaxID=4465 RepID=A0AAV9E6A2_ACOCL|nr:hypothetical protein QJS10_CPA09g01008 [Acorus calamus]